jgi:hypothetical protein
MRVRLETSGGYAGLARVAEVDTDELTSVDVDAALHALAEPAAAPPPTGPQPRYRLTVFRADGTHVVELVEPAVPDAVRPLLTELLARAQPAGLSRQRDDQPPSDAMT